MQTLTVNLGDRSYPIYLGNGILSQTGELMKRAGCGKKVGVVTNPTVGKLYLKAVQDSLGHAGYKVTPILVPDGEEHKSINALSAIYDQLIRGRFERSSSLIALGGGVVGDLAGFAAATFLRGIPYIQVPTTLLAQVDASVGGKTAINHPEGKNLIGAFYQPKLVVVDVSVLQTLPKRELAAGLAEVIKYGIIQDPELFSLLEDKLEDLLGLDQEILEKAIASSCAIKARVVEKDEREEDFRAILNFGHTVGHALESQTGYERLLHGEAVAIGMAKAATLSAGEGYCDDASLKRIHHLIERSGLPTELPSDIRLEELVKRMEVDKKSDGGKIKFILCGGIGKVLFHWLSPEEIKNRLSHKTSTE